MAILEDVVGTPVKPALVQVTPELVLLQKGEATPFSAAYIMVGSPGLNSISVKFPVCSCVQEVPPFVVL